jgi:hypothetical protein
MPYLMLVSNMAFGYAGAVASKRKITLEVPEELLERAMASTGEGVTRTVCRGLELVAAGRAYDDLRRLRGKVKLGIDLEALREDR